VFYIYHFLTTYHRLIYVRNIKSSNINLSYSTATASEMLKSVVEQKYIIEYRVDVVRYLYSVSGWLHRSSVKTMACCTEKTLLCTFYPKCHITILSSNTDFQIRGIIFQSPCIIYYVYYYRLGPDRE